MKVLRDCLRPRVVVEEEEEPPEDETPEELGVKIDYQSSAYLEEPTVLPEVNKAQEIILNDLPKRVEPKQNSTGNQSYGVLAKVLREDVGERRRRKVVKKKNGDSCQAFATILSANIPYKFYDSDSSENDGHVSETNRASVTEEIGYLRGVATSAFYNREFNDASEYFGRALAKADQASQEIDVALASLECDIYRRECGRLNAKCEEFDENLRQAGEISQRDLLVWIEELGSSNRHYGSIILCRSSILSLSLNNENANGHKEWNFILCYYIFVEMTLRVICVLKRNDTYSEVIKFMLESMEKAINKMKTYDAKGSERQETGKKIATCYSVLSFCCNCVRLYGSAERCAKDGIDFLKDVEGHTAFKIYPDLIMNLVVSFIGRKQTADAKENTEKALALFKKMTKFDTKSAKKERIKLTEDIKNKISELIKIEKKMKKWSR